MGVVYAAERADGEFRQRVAVKLLDASLRGDALRRFRSERQILATLHHPHIVTLLDGGVTAEGRAYLVMEYVDGVPISTYCAGRRLPLEARLQLFRDVCAAVQHAHQHGVVHRDLKPANILVADGTVKVLDFGIAKLLDASGAGADATMGAVQALTPNYASPEQLRGVAVTTASDIYAMGVLLYELIAGVRPYETANQGLEQVLATVTAAEPKRPSAAAGRAALPYDPESLRGDLDAIVSKAMSKDPERRYASASEFSEDLGRRLSGRPVLAREPSLWYVARTLARRHRLTVATAAVSLVALVAALGVSVWQTRVARVERDRAAARFNDTRELAHALIFSIHDQVKPLAGSTPVRRAIVAEALKYLERLDKDTEGDDGLRLELAKAYHRVGDVQGKPNEPNLGDSAGALKSLGQAASLLRPLLAHPRLASEASWELVRTDLSLMSVAHLVGPRELAAAAGQEAAAIARDIVRREPGSDEARRLLGSTLFQSAVMADAGEELALWQQAGEVFEGLLARRPDDPDRIRNVALVEKYLGTALDRQRRLPEATAHYRRALALDEARLQQAPSNRSAQFDVAIDLANLARIDWSAGRLAEATTGYERALVMRTALAASDPRDVLARRAEGYAHTRLSGLYYEMGRYRDSQVHAERAVQIGETLGSDDAHQVDLVEALNELARAQVTAGSAAAGCQAYRRAAAIARDRIANGAALAPDLRARRDDVARKVEAGVAACAGNAK